MALNWRGFALLAVLLAGLLWWGFFRTVEHVETVPISRGGIENAVTVLGVLQPQRYVDMGAQVSGRIKRIAVQPGDVVEQGDLLVEIDPAIQQATVQTNRATLARLRAQLAEQNAQRDLAGQQAQRQRKMATDAAGHAASAPCHARHCSTLKLQRLLASVALYRALGGGWRQVPGSVADTLLNTSVFP